jgi:hypothetical protein
MSKCPLPSRCSHGGHRTHHYAHAVPHTRRCPCALPPYAPLPDAVCCFGGVPPSTSISSAIALTQNSAVGHTTSRQSRQATLASTPRSQPIRWHDTDSNPLEPARWMEEHAHELVPRSCVHLHSCGMQECSRMMARYGAVSSARMRYAATRAKNRKAPHACSHEGVASLLVTTRLRRIEQFANTSSSVRFITAN